MGKKRKSPKGKSQKRTWPPIGPPDLANRGCRIDGPEAKASARKGRTRAARPPITAGIVRGEVKALGIWIERARLVLAELKPARKVLTTIYPTEGDVALAPPLSGPAGRLCAPVRRPLKVRASDLVKLLAALQKQTNAIAMQLGRFPKDLEETRPRRPAPRR